QYLMKLTSLQQLGLRSCDEITDNGLKHLIQLTSLKRLDLRDCQKITFNGLQYLQQITSLQELDLFNDDIYPDPFQDTKTLRIQQLLKKFPFLKTVVNMPKTHF